jgi:serine/threonine protein kinase
MNDADLIPGLLPAERYGVRHTKAGRWVFDRSDNKPLVVEVVDADETSLSLLYRARSLEHPNVQRIRDVLPGASGIVVLRDFLPGQHLRMVIRRRKALGGYEAGEFHRIASAMSAGLAAIHTAGLVHGHLRPTNVSVGEDRTVLLDCGLPGTGARLTVPEDVGAGSTAAFYWSPERLRGGGMSQADDVYALGLSLLEMWTCRVPPAGYRPLARSLRDQVQLDPFGVLGANELRQIYSMLHDRPEKRPSVSELSFCVPAPVETANLPDPLDDDVSAWTLPPEPPGRMPPEGNTDQPYCVAVHSWNGPASNRDELIDFVKAFSLLNKPEHVSRWVDEALNVQKLFIMFPAKNLELASKLSEAFRSQGAVTSVSPYYDDD